MAPGGRLLVVAHGEPPPWAQDHGHHRFFDPATEFAELVLDPDTWEIVVRDIRARLTTGPNGEPATLRDSVLVVRRRS